MLLEIVLTLVLLAVCVALVWPRHRSPGHPGLDARFPSGVQPPDDWWPESREGTLARQLWMKEITRPQYLRAMSQLAESDAARHPLEVPGD